ncbi:splicing factor 3A subunit 2-like [Vigna radiata var. radiata]|uniref:Splicing factor 3A subunit 2-like n=1 Tax=Vigna radiata var. radiata TaxID=3916 RepID=A0A3Q0EH11_VIGRR|nr:splicing factor 3A subunit 2-like [Vigna radiata var. radiata]
MTAVAGCSIIAREAIGGGCSGGLRGFILLCILAPVVFFLARGFYAAVHPSPTTAVHPPPTPPTPVIHLPPPTPAVRPPPPPTPAAEPVPPPPPVIITLTPSPHPTSIPSSSSRPPSETATPCADSTSDGDGVDPPLHDRPWIEPYGKRFIPSRVASQAITRVIKQQYLTPWPTWGSIPIDNRKSFWERFKMKVQ